MVYLKILFSATACVQISGTQSHTFLAYEGLIVIVVKEGLKENRTRYCNQKCLSASTKDATKP